MLNRIIRFSIKNKLLIGLMVLALIVWGLWSLTRLHVDAVTDITDNQVMVITVSPTLAAQEVERLVTYPVEQNMANIPGVENMRSFSRFGLSIVTIVFGEDVDQYWARQQVQERLSLAEKEIPEGVGKPEMAPVTTGLGEIYQYVVRPEKGYESQYSIADLRTIQDWIIKRQLLGTPGVAEVSGFGGDVNQYEVQIDPDRLASSHVTITEVYNALERNNQNTGGAYIDKNPHAYFIRSEGLVKSIDDIRNIIVKRTAEGTPVTVGDVAKVGFGRAVRYGAATRNGEGEVVTGLVMMLKGANSSEVIQNVREKIEQIKTTLPKGVTIEPFLDRKTLVDNTIHTVIRNLCEGALIVLFVLLLFLGSWRSGLLVASIIPLSLLFAVSMMQLCGISGSLMSLGAIDFGMIVDGTVIIVEASMYNLMRGRWYKYGIDQLSRRQMNRLVYTSSSRIMNAAAFGEIIIMIVYLPILTLEGTEGKMFRPMAETVAFALLGAFLLSLTYVPMMASLVLSRQTQHKANISDRMMQAVQRGYSHVIGWAMGRKRTVVGSALVLFVIAIVIFNRLGGEFIPQLEEGDFAVETRVPEGSSMQQMIEVSTKAQKILMQYPEVKQVVNKIGSGEVPTDPMPIEAGDMMVILKPKSEWTSAKTKEEIIEKMQRSLSVIPNASFSFQQPIQMRFNELLTGAKQDVVIKIYGEDLDVLSELAEDMGRRLKHVDGAEDLYVEKITGLPQINIQFNRDAIARYGLNVEDVNTVIETAFAGKAAGLVYEGEKRFDLVVRLSDENRSDVSDVQNLLVPTADGTQVPLSQLADVSYQPGPIQIQRDNAARRITMGFNVQGRDVQSTVNDIKAIVAKMDMPAGYHVTYGGQFQSLERATHRLMIAVPTALLLILLLLFFTFHNIKECLLIFTAIPLAAIGGVLALLVRGMPFSISAGVGFIALFGVAVLNGIVLIAEFNHLKRDGVKDVYERVRRGTNTRLRPVLITATVASMGFLPMALSTSAGAEVQRPLATVVIGGLISATLLTLVVLPIMYIYFSGNFRQRLHLPHKATVILLCLIGLPLAAHAQTAVTLDQAISEALKNNCEMQIADYDIQRAEALGKGYVTLPKTEVNFGYGHINEMNKNDNLIGVQQRLDFPTLYGRQRQLGRANIALSEAKRSTTANELTREVRDAYLTAQYLLAMAAELRVQDSLYARLATASDLRYRSGETTRTENTASQTKSMELKKRIRENEANMQVALRQLQLLMGCSYLPTIADTKLTPADGHGLFNSADGNPILAQLGKQIDVAEAERKVETSKALPDILLGFDNQTFGGNKRVSSFSVGLAVPLFPGGYRSRSKASALSKQIAAEELKHQQHLLAGRMDQLSEQLQSRQASLDYYQQQALPQARQLQVDSQRAFASGDISYAQHLLNLTMAADIQTAYLGCILDYNRTINEIKYITATR